MNEEMKYQEDGIPQNEEYSEEQIPLSEEENEATVSAEYDIEEPFASAGETDADITTEAPSAIDAESAQPALPEPPVEVIGVKFRASGKVYYFAPNGMTFAQGDYAVVETARGTEYGQVTQGNRTVPADSVVPPLRSVIRAATDEDKKHAEDNAVREVEAFNVCVEKIAHHKLEMKLVDVEYTFDNSRLLFYFTADGRVDFRELVKDLASVFRTRIELRQIGIRDEAKMLGGLGICGRPFCCHSFLSDFVQVSIKMAKEQNLSLNSAKISGACGRLMCCLRYESDTYEEEIARTPRVDALVRTQDGDGIVTENSPLAGWIKVRLASAPEQAPKVYHRDDVEILRAHGGKEPFEALVNEYRQREEAARTEREANRKPTAATLEQRERAPRPPKPHKAESFDSALAQQSKQQEKQQERHSRRPVRQQNPARKPGTDPHPANEERAENAGSSNRPNRNRHRRRRPQNRDENKQNDTKKTQK